MLLSQNLIQKHLQHKHQKKLKMKNYHQIPLWDHDQLCYLCKKPELYYMSNAECSSMGNKLYIDCLNQNLEYNEDMGGSVYWLSCYKCKNNMKFHSRMAYCWKLYVRRYLKNLSLIYVTNYFLISSLCIIAHSQNENANITCL